MMSSHLKCMIPATGLLLAILGCNLLSLGSTPNQADSARTPGLDNQAIQDSAGTEAAIGSHSIATNTPSIEENEGIEIEYVYTDGLVTSLYHLYGGVLDNFLDVILTNHNPGSVTVLVESYIDGYTTVSSDTVIVEPGRDLEIHQNPRLKPEALDKLNTEQPGNFNIQVTQINDGSDEILIKESKEILMYSRRDFVWIKGFEAQEEYELWAAWVTPTDPSIEELIRAAAEYTDSGMMWSGYSGSEMDDDGAVWERLEALWKAADNQYNLTYISTMTAYGPDTVQRMRLPGEVLDQASGNCVELTTMFASAAEALRLEAAIVRIPGHAYLAVRTDEVNANYYFIETTLIGQTDFSEAVDVGMQEWNETLPNLDANEEGYHWVTIADAREKGILPIPWK